MHHLFQNLIENLEVGKHILTILVVETGRTPASNIKFYIIIYTSEWQTFQPNASLVPKFE
jgi:hypothetical protein